MHFIILLLATIISSPVFAQSSNSAERDSDGTHLMGSGSKNVEGMGVNKDTTKYDQLEGKSKKEIRKKDVGNNPTGTDTIEGKNSKKISN